MSLTKTSIERPVFAWMLMAALIVFGGISFNRMGVSQLPDVDFPTVNVNLSWEGAAPEVMELDIVDPVEDALMGIQGIKSLSSSAKTGSANVTVEFELNKDIDIAVQEIQTKMAQVQRRLPKEVEPPSVSKTNPDDQPILWLAVTSSKMSPPELMTFVRDRVKDKFSTIEGVGEVFMGGYIEPSLRVWVQMDKLNQYEFAISDILSTIQSEHSELPAGRIETLEKEYNVRTMGEAPTAEQFGKMMIQKRGGSPNFTPISLSQVARVEEGLSDIRRKSRSGGKPAVGLGIRKQRGANAVQVAHDVKDAFRNLNTEMPEGTQIGVRFDSTQFIEESVGELNFTLLLSALLTALVCWLFLGSWSATMNVVLAIPTSVIGTFIVLNALGFTLNTFTLLGLSLAIGIVVDDAIMVLENIVRHAEGGKPRRKAALDGALEITFAAMAATAAIIAIFLPVAFMKGVIGKFFFQFGVTLSVAVALSLLEALTLTPMRCAEYLSTGSRTSRLGRLVEGAFRRSAEIYRGLIPHLLAHRFKVIAASLVFFILTFALVKFIPKEMTPSQDQSRLMVRLKTPIGSSIELTDSRLIKMEEWISKQPETLSYFSSVGGFGGGGDVNAGMMFVTLKEPGKRGKDPQAGKELPLRKIIEKWRKGLSEIPDVRIVISDPSGGSAFGGGGRGGFPVGFTVRGPDWNQLVENSQKIIAKMKANPHFVDVDTDYQEGMPEVRINPDRAKAKARGVSVADIGQTVNSTMGGVVAGKYAKGGHRYDVRVRLEEKDRDEPEDVAKLRVRNNRGELIPLSNVVTVETRKALQGISRQDRERAIGIFANVGAGKSQAQAIDEAKKLTSEILPPGYRAVMTGSAQAFQESFQSLLMALVLGLVVSYMVLASQFNSFVHPFTVLIALPFSISGAFISLLLGGQSLNVFSMIGLLLLLGIVKKNSILLVDFTNQLREQGLGVREALIQACPTRLRPILMTSIATVVGAIPPALAIGPGAETRIPMALAVIGGMVVSTALTLFVVPCVYSLWPGKIHIEKSDT